MPDGGFAWRTADLRGGRRIPVADGSEGLSDGSIAWRTPDSRGGRLGRVVGRASDGAGTQFGAGGGVGVSWATAVAAFFRLGRREDT